MSHSAVSRLGVLSALFGLLLGGCVAGDTGQGAAEPGSTATPGTAAAPADDEGGVPPAPGSSQAPGSPAPGGQGAGACVLWRPAPTDSWVWDLETAAVPSPSLNGASGVSNYRASVYDVDLFLTSASQIAAYHADGKRVICYVDAGSWESGRDDSAAFDPACWCGAGSVSRTQCNNNAHKMDGWPEYWLDIRATSACKDNVRGVLAKRLALAKSKGCDAVEPDNVDAYDNQGGGWGITQAAQKEFNLWLAKTAHDACLGILLKNAGGLIDADIVAAFDGSLNEQCHQYDECDVYAPFARAGKAMLNAEYSGATAKPAYCRTPGMRTLQYNSLNVNFSHLISVCP